MTDLLDWRGRHADALVNPRGAEVPIVQLRNAINAYVTYAESTYADASGWRDYVLGEAVGDMLAAFRELLNGELGRLDGGTLDAWVVNTAERIGYDLNLGTMSGK